MQKRKIEKLIVLSTWVFLMVFIGKSGAQLSARKANAANYLSDWGFGGSMTSTACNFGAPAAATQWRLVWILPTMS